MTVVIIIFFLSYTFVVLLLIIGWKKATAQHISAAKEYFPPCSIIIPVRNESQTIQNLLEDILRQSYKNFEVIVVNDHSTDNTVELVRSYSANDPRVKLWDNAGEGKKSALSKGIMESAGEIIVTTDGDCRVGERWLEGMISDFQNEAVQFVFGGVKIVGNSFFSTLQSHEFLSLMGTAAASQAYQFPTMCNGANLAFQKAAFLEVGGYSGNLHIASGDDEFLMRKIFKKYPAGVTFANTRSTVVSTAAADSIKQFLHQRIRWAGKWRHNQSLSTKLLALFIFSFHTMVLLLVAWAFSGWVDLSLALTLLVIKALVEWFFLRKIARFLNVKWDWVSFISLQIVYSCYVVATALVSNVRSYEWKGRKSRLMLVHTVKK